MVALNTQCPVVGSELTLLQDGMDAATAVADCMSKKTGMGYVPAAASSNTCRSGY